MSVVGWRWSGLLVAGALTAVAVTGVVSGSGGAGETVFVPVAPCRLVDTRPNTPSSPARNIGPLSAPIGTTPAEFTAWDSGDGNSTCVIPSSATAISTNTTIVNPTAAGYLSLFPADKPWPGTSNLNFAAGQRATPNAVTTPLSPTGKFKVLNAAGTVNVIIDVVGYYQPSTSIGATGPAGPTGPAGTDGTDGDDGTDAPSPDNVLWVAKSGGDFTSIAAAMATLAGNGPSTPFVIRVGPGLFEEPPIVVEDYVDIVGSGQGTTLIVCACSGAYPGAAIYVDGEYSQVRDLAVFNTGGTGDFSIAIAVVGTTPDSIDLRDVTATAFGGATDNYGVLNLNSAPLLDNVTASAVGPHARGVFNTSGASPTILNSRMTGTDGSVYNFASSTALVSDSALDGPITGTGFSCVAARTATGVALGADCQAAPVYAIKTDVDAALAELSALTALISPVTTLAGTDGVYGSANGNGTDATFWGPQGVAVDGSGNVYVADTVGNRIRKITPARDVTTFAGSGSSGSADGTGGAASFYTPSGVAVDGSGNVYVADTFNHLIRKITPAGAVTTFAGTGSQGSANGTGTAASFAYPYGLAVDGSGNVYVADQNNRLIRKITPAGVVTTLAGSGSSGSADGTGVAASFNSPRGVAVDGSGNVYVADTFNHLIRKITPAGVVTTLAGTGSSGSANGNGTSASFSYPRGVAVDGSGNVLVADRDNNLIRVITPAGDVTTLAGTAGVAGSANGLSFNSTFNSPRTLAIDGSGKIYIADTGNHLIRKIG